MPDLLVRDATIMTMGRQGILEGSLYAVDGRIVELPSGRRQADTVIEGRGRLVVPGFVQAHVHLCQTLFRGLADDLDVVDWLRTVVWPLEQAHDADSLGASAALGIAELLLGGTTTVLSMETIRYTEASFEAAAELGIRALIGPALMDRFEPGTEMIGQSTQDALDSVTELLQQWHGASQGRLGLALSPRGPRNATPELWRACVEMAAQAGLVLHTHVNENATQAARLDQELGGRDVYALDSYGALSPRLVMAHAVWLEAGERDLVGRRGAHVCHCPSANLKLASGLAPIPEYLAEGINVALGADGAACNNNLSAFTEMRLAALIHKPRLGPRTLLADQIVRLATMGGATALGLGDQIGSLEVGKRADVVVISRDGAHCRPLLGGSLASELVYAHQASDVTEVVVDGRLVVADGQLLSGDLLSILDRAESQRRQLLSRASMGGAGAPGSS